MTPRKRTTGLGIVGTGGMANTHARRFNEIRGVKLIACCDVDEARAAAFAARYNIPSVFADYRAMLNAAGLEAVSIVTPDRLHAPISIAALNAGLHVLCEKPLATSFAEGKRMLAAATKAGTINVVNFSYRNSSALQACARLIAAGKIGRVMHVETCYLQSWLSSPAWGDWRTSPGWLWRLSSKHGSLGTLGDIGCHIYDATALLAGDFDVIFSTLKTFDKEVKGNRIGEYEFDVNDSVVSNVEFKNGAVGTVHTTRWATGHLNTLKFRVYGDKGAIAIDLDRSYSDYEICAGKAAIADAAWKTVRARATPDMYQRFITSIRTGKQDPSDFANALKVQSYLHYSYESGRKRRPMKIV